MSETTPKPLPLTEQQRADRQRRERLEAQNNAHGFGSRDPYPDRTAAVYGVAAARARKADPPPEAPKPAPADPPALPSQVQRFNARWREVAR